MSSSDGFCSALSFAPGELGQLYSGSTSAAQHPVSSGHSSATVTPLPTPTHVPSPVKTSHHAPSNSTGSAGPAAPSASQAPPASPTRSNSASSGTTQLSTVQSTAMFNNPTPTLGSVPLVTATHSAQPSALPLTTPPQTPMSAGPTGGAANTTTNSSSVLGKRDLRTAGDTEREDGKDAESGAAQQPKKRRVAPTLISTGTGSESASKDDSRNADVGG
ncbi:Chromatin assembly factor 1 subunit B [Penicillium lagena]|uniref:Chromatin assembly factor 1 subunit B n=1 Tax=Penicillium lagena TaxID=94218 RepID=UPI002541553E|nr:Chromatin assembly factor 1 subunit B [Penicillium lagena]KAJ5601996.1 Chromatin assembly factor 1 subunit B [Penicillium lagena]